MRRSVALVNFALTGRVGEKLGFAMIILYIFAAVFVAAALAARFTPADVAKWHVAPKNAPDPGEGGVKLVGDKAPTFDGGPRATLERLDRIAMATPRTVRFAGSFETGMITYQTRTFFWGFPDYTTVAAIGMVEGCKIAAVARLRYGRKDFGVNKTRLDGWIAALSDAKEA